MTDETETAETDETIQMNQTDLMKGLGDTLRSLLKPMGCGFALLVFPTGADDGIANYIADCEREDMIKFLRATADRLENKEDNQR